MKMTITSEIVEKNPYHSTGTGQDIYVLNITAEGFEKDLEYIRDMLLNIKEGE